MYNNTLQQFEPVTDGAKAYPADFRNEYALAAALANMPSHSVFAMDKVKSVLKEPDYFEEQLGVTVRNRIKAVRTDSTYAYKDIWSASKADFLTFVCRPLGLKLLIDSTWNITLHDYQKNQAAVIIVPPPIISKKGRSITYTIALIMRVEKKGESLDKFIGNFIGRYPVKNEIKFSDIYPGMLAFELKDPGMYSEIGGGHMNMLGIKRDRPPYPGLLLEEPASLPGDNSQEVSYYTVNDSMDRFPGNIYYAVMLDACEDIYAEASAVFKEMFTNRLIIE